MPKNKVFGQAGGSQEAQFTFILTVCMTFWKSSSRNCRQGLVPILNRMMDEDGMLNDHIRKYALEYLAGAIISLVRYWLECNDDVSVEEITKMANVIRYARGTLQDMIEKNDKIADVNH